MRAEYKIGAPELSGVYSIRNLVDGKTYIGSTNRFRQRHKDHARKLRSGKHYNKHLQAAYDKYGPDNFVFEPICVVDGDRVARANAEQNYLDVYTEDQWRRCLYNRAKQTIRTQGPWSYTPEETRQKISRAKAKEFVFISPAGAEVTVRNLKKFCQENGLHLSSMCQVAKGIYKHHKNWHLVGTPKPKPKPIFLLTDTDGNIIAVENLAQFCRENDLSHGAIKKVVAGKTKQHKKWRLVGTDLPKPKKLISPDNKEVIIYNVSVFCQTNNLSQRCIHRVITGARSHHKGWRQKP